jgi:hypothetical protein
MFPKNATLLGLQELALRNAQKAAVNPALLESLPAQHQGSVAALDFCGMLHPSHPHSCNRHFLGILPQLFARSFLVYLPVYIASVIAVHRGKLWKQPTKVGPRMLLSTARSSAFLAVYVAVAHRGM